MRALSGAACFSTSAAVKRGDELAPESLRSKVQRLFLIQVISYDWNCPQ
jgi:hypothetical protein